MQQINLLRSLPENKPFILPFKVVKWFLLALFVLFFFVYVFQFISKWYSDSNISSLEKRKAQLTQEMLDFAKRQQSEQALGSLTAKIKSLKIKTEERQKVIDVLSVKKSMSFADVLSYLANISSKKLWLTEIIVSSDQKDFICKGGSLTPTAVFDYVNKLKELPMLKNKELLVEGLKKTDADIYTFTIYSRGTTG